MLRKVLLVLALCLLGFSHSALAAQAVTDENMAKALEKIFKERPDLVLEVLRQNSEAVLDIAQQGSTLRRKRNLEAQWREDLKQPKKVALDDRPSLGPANAPVTIVAFSDFTCPYCEQAYLTMQQIMSEYSGKVRYIFKHMPVGKDSAGRVASEYFVAAGMQNPEKAWALYNEFFAQRERLMAEGEVFIKEAATKVGLNMSKLAGDLKARKVKDTIDQDLGDAKKLNVEGTPYFLVNDLTIRGALPLELFRGAVDMALAAKGKK